MRTLIEAALDRTRTTLLLLIFLLLAGSAAYQAIPKESNPDVVIRPLDPTSHRRIHAVTTEDLLKVPAVAATLEALVASAAAATPASV